MNIKKPPENCKNGDIAMKRLRNNPQIRSLFMLIRDAKIKRAHDRYLRSPDSWYLKTLKGIHDGKRCFIIGNGPSLRASDLDKLKEEYTFAANRIFEIFDETEWRPSFYLAVDPDFLKENLEKLTSYDLDHLFLAINEKKMTGYPVNKVTRIYFTDIIFKIYKPPIWNDLTSYVSMDISNHFSNGYTVTFQALQLAIYMGFTEIYLLGVDFNYSVIYDAEGKVHRDESVTDYFNGKTYPSSLQNYASNLQAYYAAREYCVNHNIRIMNATRGGKLEVFDRTTLEEILGGV